MLEMKVAYSPSPLDLLEKTSTFALTRESSHRVRLGFAGAQRQVSAVFRAFPFLRFLISGKSDLCLDHPFCYIMLIPHLHHGFQPSHRECRSEYCTDPVGMLPYFGKWTAQTFIMGVDLKDDDYYVSQSLQSINPKSVANKVTTLIKQNSKHRPKWVDRVGFVPIPSSGIYNDYGIVPSSSSLCRCTWRLGSKR